MGPAEVHCQCHETVEFQLRGMDHDDKFVRYLKDPRKQVGRDNDRAAEDLNSLQKATRNHPVPRFTHKGHLQWNGSLAQTHLQEDMATGLHKTMKPSELWERRGGLHKQHLSKDGFGWKIRTVSRTEKCPHTLKHEAELKLRACPKDTPVNVP